MKVIETFQFQTGSIKSGMALTLRAIGSSFNSKLVRLKVEDNKALGETALFQFQTGSIKSSFACLTTLRSVFQFQTGSIKRTDYQ